jgi:hypothetical protein
MVEAMTAHDGTHADDAALRRALTQADMAEAPPDLVQRALERLPAAPPAALYRQERSRHAAGIILRSSSLGAVVALVVLCGWGAMGAAQLVQPNDETIAVVRTAMVAQATVLPREGLIVRATLASLVGLGLLVPCALLLGRWPLRTSVAALTLGRLPLRSIWLGLPLALALSALLLAAARLAITLVGLPLGALLALVAVAPLIVGLVTLARVCGALLDGRSPGPELGWPTAAVAALLVLVLAAATLLLPPLALALFVLLAAPGVGAAVLSRAGTQRV